MITAAEERRRVLERHLGLSNAYGVIVAIVFFVLTSLGVAAMFGLADELGLPKGWVTAILSIALAEYLIRRFGFWETGVESALWTGGLFAFIFGLPGEGKPEALLLFALAFAIAGRRVRNPLVGAATAIFVIAYFGAKHWGAVALVAGIAIAAGALVLRSREWQRPSTDMLFIVLMLVAPVSGAIAGTIAGAEQISWGVAFAALATAHVALGVWKRDRVSFVAAAVDFVIGAVLLREVFDFLPLEWKLIASGAAMFAIATLVSRKLRGRTRGFVVTPVKSAYEEALRIFGTAAFAPHAAHEPVQEPVGAGGNFGGAGATGEY